MPRRRLDNHLTDIRLIDPTLRRIRTASRPRRCSRVRRTTACRDGFRIPTRCPDTSCSSYPRVRPLNELWRRSPSEVISRNSTSAVNDGSTHIALGLRVGFVSLEFGLITASQMMRMHRERFRLV